ncbi:MAG TPA: proline racemase family protein [Gemmatimonadaceae bacterium]|nr:proline racemase family protein [Gemmatimonadaceae bacterium]
MTDAPFELSPMEIVDSHTEGEPTRVVISGWPEPLGATMVERREALRRECDAVRRAVVCEPRGHDAIVGALLTSPVTSGALAGVIFFNDVGYLGMCGHGLIGVVRTLDFLGRLTPGTVCIDTPAGTVRADLSADGLVTVRNVPAYRYRADVEVNVPGLGRLRGDVSYGGNWFFLTELPDAELELANVRELTRVTTDIREALAAQGITGADGAPVDHVELFGAPHRDDADSRNFVLCPGAAYDRSPCGTGTSAKMATLHARGELGIGERWRQESITGSLFTGWLEECDGTLVPHVQGRAYITSRATLVFDKADPFRLGIPAR